ncbi:MAG: DUF2207 domain-containing protein [Candidatus Paceibacterota bacterium]
MKIISILKLFGFLIFFFCLAPIVLAEKIENYEVKIVINKDSSLLINENIVYNFESEEKHGIFRDIPVRYLRNNLSYNLRILEISVKNEKGDNYKFEKYYSNNNLRIKIGEADKLITGIHSFVINYKIEQAFNYFDDYDEFYWNINGFDWPVSISSLSASIILPKRIIFTPDDFHCFQGVYGSQDACDFFKIDSQEQTTNINFGGINISPKENLSVLIKIPKGVVFELSSEQAFKNIIFDNWILALPLLIFIVLFFIWYRFGRDPKGRGVIIPEYDIPNKLTPIEIGTVIDQSTDHQDISAEIIYLAIKGYLKIIKKEKSGTFKEDYLFQKEKIKNLPENQFDRDLMEYLFNARDEITLSEIKAQNQKLEIKKKTLAEVIASTSKELENKNYFNKDFWKPIVSLILVGELLFILLVVFYSQTAIFSNWSILATIFSQVIIIIFPFLVSRRTKQGVLLKEKIKGLKLYLSVAEKRRLDFHNSPEKNPQVFEKFLPYAMALQVEKQWAEQFKGIDIQTSNQWYSSSAGNNFSAIVLMNDLNGFKSSVNPVFSSIAASGHSGFSSGSGFSGGGFGGGGGGSW